MSFWHYTCTHAHAKIGVTGTLTPLRDLVSDEAFAGWPAWRKRTLDIVWLTNLDQPWREALGLTSKTLGCDRTAHRYRVIGYSPMRYTAVRRDLPKLLRDGLENAPGAMPVHWWLAYTPVPVVYDPVLVGAA